jgi:ATP-dependent Clp protease ATP-binding subunit ClpC
MKTKTAKDIDRAFELEGQQLFWGRHFSEKEIVLRNFSNFLENLTRVLLFAICLLGIGALGYHLWYLARTGLSILNSQSWRSPALTYFWWSVVGDMYFFFHLNLNSGKKFQVLKKTFSKIRPSAKAPAKIDFSDSFSHEALKIIDKAFLSASRQKKVFNLFYLFNSLLQTTDTKVIFIRLEASLKNLVNVVKNLLIKQPLGQEQVDPQIYQVFSQAYQMVYNERRSRVEVADLVWAVVSLDKLIQDILLEIKITPEMIANVVSWINVQKLLQEKYRHYRSRAYFKPKGTMNRAMTALATPMLDSFSEDLTLAARAGYLPLCVAREKEIEEILHIIEGGNSSVLIVGQPGVGKSNIIEGLANMMVAEEVPEILQDKRFVSLSIAHMVAGASRPNELEQRAVIIMNEIMRAGNIILHIDNIHDLVGLASVGTENVDLSEIFAKFLSHKSLITIAATNVAEYKTYIEGKILGEVLTTVNIEEPDDNQAIKMIESKVAVLEGRNEIFFSYAALERAVKLSRRYIMESYLPDKAYKILEEVSALVKNEKGKNSLVTAEDVAKAISHRTGIPLTEVTEEESQKLMGLEEKIHERMVNQVEAVVMVATALRRARAELRDNKRPIVNLMFLGPTGVGKTELAKTVAEVYFGAEEKMIRLDMSEYQEQKSLSRLLGDASQGIGGLLTDAVRKQPFSLVLLDEIEKAHPDIINIFLQVMDDGRLTDALGKTADFTNCIIIATSNAGTQFIMDSLRQGKNIDQVKNELMLNQLKTYFKPEFLNRFDGIVVFKPLTEDQIELIAVLLIDKVRKNLETKGIFLEVTPAAIRELAKLGFDPVFGARPLRRLIQEKIDDALANFLLTQKVTRRDLVTFDVGGKITVKKAIKYN